jgi:alkylated DNA repair dioxygenase AlkB
MLPSAPLPLLRASACPNLLPQDGTVLPLGPLLTEPDATAAFQALLTELPWQHDQVRLFGKRIVTARKTSWHGDQPFSYTYSGIPRTAQPWTPTLAALKAQIEAATATSYNSCLANLYHSGAEGMAWHSDDEPMLLRHAPIASLSLGAPRRFDFKHKKHPSLRASILLEHGHLLLMLNETQTHWLHALPKTKKATSPRINLTFRTISKVPRLSEARAQPH